MTQGTWSNILAVLGRMWVDLPATGKTVVVIVGILALTGLLASAMFLGYRLDWIPTFLSGG